MDEEALRQIAHQQPPTACAACGSILDLNLSPEGQPNWLHPGMLDPDIAPHEPEPVPVDELQEAELGRCDFCLSRPVTHRLPVRDFKIVAAPKNDHWSSEDWAACGTCAVLLERDQWSALRRRALASMKRRGERVDPRTETALSALYRAVRDNVSGALIPVR